MAKPFRHQILLVEDEALIAASERLQLEQYGYAVSTVSSGEDAIAAVRANPDIELILMDINLGAGIDGTQAAATILEDRDLPIVFLSSHTQSDVVEKTERITSYGYVVKNSSIAVLDASIKMAFKLFDAKVQSREQRDALHQSEEKYRLQFMHMNAHNSMYEVVTDETGTPCDFRFLMVNRAFEKFVGKRASELVGRTLLEVFPKTEQYWIDQMVHVAMTGEPRTYENFSVELDTDVEINLFVPKQGQLVMTSTDVTERRRMERELTESVARYRELVDHIPVGVYTVWLRADGSKDFEYVSDRWCEIHGVSRDSVMADASVVDRLVHPDDRDGFIRRNRECARTREPFKWEGRFFHGDGGIRWVRLESIHTVDRNGDSRWYGVTQDITDRKHAEERYRLLFNYSNDAIFVHEIDAESRPSRNIEVNDQAVRLLGYTKEELLNMTVMDVSPEEGAAAIADDAQSLLEQKHLVFESSNIRKDGSVVPIEVSAYLHTEGDRRLVVSSVRDITARKQYEQRLLGQKQYLETILETTADGFWVVAPDRRIVNTNSAYCRMSGYTKTELLQMNVNDIEAVEDPQETRARVEWIMKHGSETFETQHRRKSGEIIDVEVTASRLDQPDGAYLVAFFRNITSRLRMQRELQTTRARYEALVERSPEIVYLFGTKSGGIFWSAATRRVLGYEPNEIVNDPFLWIHSIHPEDREMVAAAIEDSATGMPFDMEYRIQTKAGNWVWLRDTLIDRTEQNGEIVIQGHAEDITERKRAEESVRKQLLEKDILLREVHHRVKNNMGAIESLLSLRLESTAEPEARTVLQEAISRVQSTRLLYDKLLIGDDHQAVSMKEYTEGLIDSLAAVFQTSGNVVIDTNIAEFSLPSKTAFTVGIAVNELLTNAFKYAFPGRDDGQVRVDLSADHDTGTLVITDDGVGMADDKLSAASGGFGLTVVSMLAEQLGGTITISSEHGTRVCLEFPVGSG